MRKKICLFLMILMSVVVLSSCDNFFQLINGTTTSNTVKLDYSYNESVKIKYATKRNTLMYELNNRSYTYEELYEAFLEIDNHVMDIATYANMEYVKFAIDGSEQTYNKYMNLSTYLSELLDWEKDVLKEIYSSNYKTDFFVGMTDEEILEYLGPDYNDDFKRYESEAAEIIAQYALLEEDSLLLNTPRIYSNLVSTYNKMAKAAGYNNYLEYSYKEIYGRDYSVEDSKILFDYVVDYIVPIYFDLYEEVEDTLDSLSNINYNKVASFFDGTYKDNMSMFESYAKYIGGSYYTNYQGLFNGGYAFFSNKSYSVDGAFTAYLYNLDTPAVYFGPSYQDISTVVHEYGHYYAMKCQNGGGASMDLNETHSQGNEMLFLSYVENNGGYTETVSNIISKYTLMSMLTTMIYATAVNQFEIEIYTKQPGFSNYDTIFRSIFDELGGYEKYKELIGNEPLDYWKYVVVENAGYYISYAASIVPSICLYSESKESLDNAIDIYNKLCNYSPYTDDFQEVIVSSGLPNPFTYEAFECIIDLA